MDSKRVGEGSGRGASFRVRGIEIPDQKKKIRKEELVMKKRKTFIGLLLVIVLFILSETAIAVDPRDALPAPEGTKVLAWYYAYLSGHDKYVNGTNTGNNTNIESTNIIIRPIYYGKNWVMTAYFPWGNKMLTDLTMPAAVQHQNVEGMGDVTLAGGYWFINDRANKNYLIGGLYITAPTGDYHDTKLLNMGNNVWTFRPEIGFAKGWGALCIQPVVGAVFYTDNANYNPLGAYGRNVTLKRDPLYYAELHASFNFTPEFWFGTSLYYNNGAQSTANDVKNNDDRKDWTLGFTANYLFNRNISLSIGTKMNLATYNSYEANELIRISLKYAW